MKYFTNCNWFFSFVLFLLVNAIAHAAPLKTTTSLPLSGRDIADAINVLKSEDEAEHFTQFIKSLDVYPDHQNPVDITQIDNRSVKKSFYVAPYFQASSERAVVGGQEIADFAIKIIAETFDLVSSFDFELLRMNQFEQERSKKLSVLEKMRKKLPDLKDPLAQESTVSAIKDIENEIAMFNKKIAALEVQAARGIDETSATLRRQVINQIQLKLSFLGVTATKAEIAMLKSDNGVDICTALSKLIARASGGGQFGFRNAIYEAGYDRQQRDWLGLYRSIRPDVSLSTLPTKVVYARGTALSGKTDSNEDANYFLGGDQIVNGHRLFVAVNGGSRGACGNTKSCNVTMEFNWLGASMAKTSRSGAIIMPIFFEAEVAFMQPEFDGSISCDFANGFSAKGRADVKDGAVIYDGDVYNKINYASTEEGACNYQINKGDADAAAYYTIKMLYENYLSIKMQRAAKSRDEKDRYRDYVNRELAYHANESQNTNFDFWSLNTWTSALGGPWGTLASFVIGGARSFYWHTRVEDSTTVESVKFTTTIKESNVTKTERMAFDGFTLLCWKQDGLDAVLAACPPENLSTYQKRADTDLGKNQSLCDDLIDGDCMDRADDNAKNPSTDDKGVLDDYDAI